MLWFFKKKRHVTLVLGGGSARGIAHIGVLKVLEKAKIPIDQIVGTSMGALVGAGYSVGVPIEEMEERAYKFSANKLLDPTMPKMGLLAGGRLEATVKEMVNGKGFEDCKIPFAVVTTDIQNGEEVVHQKGNLTETVRASCSWPGIFNPVKIDGRLLCDGGIKHSVPTKIAYQLGADYVLAVDVGFCVKKDGVTNIFQIILQSFQIMGEELNHYQTLAAERSIKVDLGDLDQVSFERSREAVSKGIVAAEMKIEDIKKDLGIK